MSLQIIVILDNLNDVSLLLNIEVDFNSIESNKEII